MAALNLVVREVEGGPPPEVAVVSTLREVGWGRSRGSTQNRRGI